MVKASKIQPVSLTCADIAECLRISGIEVKPFKPDAKEFRFNAAGLASSTIRTVDQVLKCFGFDWEIVSIKNVPHIHVFEKPPGA